MLLQTVLYITSVVSAIALIALILVTDRPQRSRPAEGAPDAARTPSPGLARATAWSTGLFLTSALLIALADLRTTGSVLDFVEAPRGSEVEAAAAPAAPDATSDLELVEAGLGVRAR
jgi:preprotein translocase subunit SecG